MALPAEKTLLVLEGIGVPLYSARGLKQTLILIDAAKQLRTTINGVLDDVSRSQFRKWKSTITCRDIEAPAFDGLAIGALVQVSCIQELVYPTSGLPSRAVVTDSSRTVGSFTIYRPLLDMRVTGFSLDQDEYGREVGWTLDLEELVVPTL